MFDDQGEPIVVKIPTELREAYARWAAPSIATLAETGVLPLLHESIVSLEQIPKLIDEVSSVNSVSVFVCAFVLSMVEICGGLAIVEETNLNDR